ncbi:conserved hypothetical protein [Streptococcus infantis SK1302]|uniref:Uncharacterized protein n=1 Tax=Streptococcus infantis SK1302 TaxID=871237 RepID=A0ABP2J802_9STRE|nr:conserved hypothetical protein [Streptococcus infantis SK1302]
MVVNLQSRKYHLIEKRIKYNGTFLNYFSENLIQAQPKISPKKSIKELEKTAQRIAETFNTDDFQFQSKVKSAILTTLKKAMNCLQKNWQMTFLTTISLHVLALLIKSRKQCQSQFSLMKSMPVVN